MGYLSNFIVYTLAMVGVVAVALVVFKTSTSTGTKRGAKFLKVHDTLSLGPRKTLYIVSAGDEKFLIAGDIDKTTLISKLNENKSLETKQSVTETFKDTLENLPTKNSYIDRSIVGIYKTQKKPYESVMKNLAEKIRQ
ncbi:flagellar biosynthetic protein FliO [bacterium]|nr:flagellar biosynthetic protein FliO [bacterium]